MSRDKCTCGNDRMQITGDRHAAPCEKVVEMEMKMGD